MIKDKIIVCVSASFEEKEALLHTIRKYSQYSTDHFAFWDEFAFTTEPLPECDALLVFNTPGNIIRTICHPEMIVAFMMEPGIKKIHPWMFKKLNQYSRIYSPIVRSENSTRSHGYLGWYFHQDYNYLKALAIPTKNKLISCIASNLLQLKGQRQRSRFVHLLQRKFPQIDFFGKGINFIPDKMNGLLSYRYSIAIENTSADDYFTEKINDCFLTYTVPLYYGCKNIDKYFPEKSFIQIDIEDPEMTFEKIQKVLDDDNWNDRVPAIREARNLVLNKYQPLAGAAEIFRNIQPLSGKKKIILTPVRPIFKRLSSAIYKLMKK